jgi:hypothetical protein
MPGAKALNAYTVMCQLILLIVMFVKHSEILTDFISAIKQTMLSLEFMYARRLICKYTLPEASRW